jgi:hypothetical protein
MNWIRAIVWIGAMIMALCVGVMLAALKVASEEDDRMEEHARKMQAEEERRRAG